LIDHLFVDVALLGMCSF